MLLTVSAILIFAALIAGLIAGAVVIRRRQRLLGKQREAAQLQRRADHLFKIALAAQVHTHSDAIAQALLAEATRVLEYALQLDPQFELAANSLRECHELITNIESEPKLEANNALLNFPQTELIEAQMHLTEAARLLIGLEKRGLVSYEALSEMTLSLKQAQRAIDLRLQLQRASDSIDSERTRPKFDEAQAGEFLAALDRNRAQS